MISEKKNIFSGAIFVKSNHVQQFCEGLHIFCTNFLRFCLYFHQIKTFGGAVPSPAPRLLRLGCHLVPPYQNSWLRACSLLSNVFKPNLVKINLKLAIMLYIHLTNCSYF